ncbi:hypothetical protein NESM_000017900 [Novymonas esmeraldas]|uniref:Uncharacterized protein n=1 Tax=Novymonas esmeraldas TaxID=1808958 RepID=A0AAW0F0W8_9TRYP
MSSAAHHHHHHHSLELDRSMSLHYYHCVLHGVPFQLPVSELATHVVPQKASGVVQRLASVGCRVVPHQLHVYKEPLETKFGYVSFFVHLAPHTEADTAAIHALVCEWIRTDLASQLATAQCMVQLAQPPECHSSEPFLDAFRLLCPLLDPSNAADTKKLETFVLARVSFADHGGNETINELNVEHCTRAGGAAPAASGASSAEDVTASASSDSGCPSPEASRTLRDHVWQSVGTFSVNSLSPKELVWLKKQLPSFPPLLITNGDAATTRCDTAKLADFFTTALAPLFTVVVEEVNEESSGLEV